MSGLNASGASDCTVIIGTLANANRCESLWRAIESIRVGNTNKIEILVVVNGTQFDPELVKALQDSEDVQLIQLLTASFAGAIYAGRTSVTTEYFAFLDDDDEYLPGGVDARVALLAGHPNAALVVSNGYRVIDGRDVPAFGAMLGVEDDPLDALFRENWLASCGGLFRNSAVPDTLFNDIPAYLEWTWLAFVIASANKKVKVLHEPTFRINDTSGSESKSEAYLLSLAESLSRMRRMAERADIVKIIAARESSAFHDISLNYAKSGQRAAAWRAHWRSLCVPGGLRYLTYTRHLTLPMPHNGP